jgi:hypothetical protein
MIQGLFNVKDDEWFVMVGRYILNMGVVEMATRLLIDRIEGTDAVAIFSGDLDPRLGFIRKRFPRKDDDRHKWAMKVLQVAAKHAGFRNIVAHSPLLMASRADGSYEIMGIMNVTPKSRDNIAQLISLEELKGRVDESAVVGKQLLEMQVDFAALDERGHPKPSK